MGMVYKARDLSLDEVVAIKVLRPDIAREPRMTERFKSEIRLARRVRHKNVCAIHDYGEDQGLLFISMEYVEGVDLKRWLREHGSFEVAEAYHVAIQVAEGLQAVHEEGIIHRDLKTPNIMRDAAGVARLMDFGIAKREGEGTGAGVTATGHIVGTPEYMSPEQAQGRRVDFRSDIYGLGIVTYEIFTGRVPFKGETPISTILKHLYDPPPLEPPEGEAIPASVRAVLSRCLAKDPAQRFDSARHVAEALRDARSPSRRQQPIPTSALQAPTLEAATADLPAPRPVRPRGPLQTWLLVIPIALVASAAVVATLTMRRAAPREVASAVSASTTLPAPLLRPTLPPEEVAAVTPKPLPAPPTTRVAAPQLRAAPVTTPRRPLATLPARVTSPAPTAAATTAPPAEPGLVQVVVRPWGEVSIDGRVVGTTPLDRISMPPGPHALRVRHPQYELWERTIVVRAGQTEKVVVDLPAQGVRRQP